MDMNEKSFEYWEYCRIKLHGWAFYASHSTTTVFHCICNPCFNHGWSRGLSRGGDYPDNPGEGGTIFGYPEKGIIPKKGISLISSIKFWLWQEKIKNFSQYVKKLHWNSLFCHFDAIFGVNLILECTLAVNVLVFLSAKGFSTVSPKSRLSLPLSLPIIPVGKSRCPDGPKALPVTNPAHENGNIGVMRFAQRLILCRVKAACYFGP